MSIINHAYDYPAALFISSKSDKKAFYLKVHTEKNTDFTFILYFTLPSELFEPRQSNNWEVRKKRAKTDGHTCGLSLPYWEQNLCSHKQPGFLIIPHRQVKPVIPLNVWLRTYQPLIRSWLIWQSHVLGNVMFRWLWSCPCHWKWGRSVYPVILSAPQHSGFL